MADKVISLQVKINSETGALDVLGAKFKGVGEEAKKAQSSLGKLRGEAGDLLKSFLPFATGAGIVAFFTNAVKASEAHAESLRRLKGNMDAAGISFDANRTQVIAWSEAIQAATRFDNDVAIESLERFIRVTGNLAQAQRATVLAMDLSVRTGKTLEESQQIIVDLLSNQERGLRQVNKEFAGFTHNARTSQEAIDRLSTAVDGAARNEEGLTKTVGQTKAAFDDFSRTIGDALSPAVAFLIRQTTNLFRVFESLGSLIAGVMAGALDGLNGVSRAMMAIATLHFSKVGDIFKETMSRVHEDAKNTDADLNRIWEKQTEKQINEAMKAGEGRLQVTTAVNEQLKAKIAEFEDEISKNIAALGEETFQKKVLMLQQEIGARRAKISREITDETSKAKLLQKLDNEQFKRTQVLVKAETKIKTDAAFKVASDSILALQILNSMQEGHTKEEARRAKILLALQQAIAIANLWRAEAGKGVVGIALAAAGTAVILAQFAQQSKAIDQARSAASQGQSELQVSMPLPGGGDLNQTFPNGSGAPGTVTAPGSAGGSSSFPGGGGGGGGGQTVINVGPITLNLQVDSLDLSDRRTVLRALGEEIRRESIEAVTFARSSAALAQKREGQAV